MADKFGRALVIVVGLIGCVMGVGSANASTITYDLTLTPFSFGFGPSSGVGGSGTLIVDDTAGLNSGHVTVTELDITMNDGVVFDFTGKNLADASATIYRGNLVSLDARDTNNQNSLDLYTGWPFVLEATFDRHTYELISAVDPPSTPLPPTWTLMLIGIVVFGFVTARGPRRNCETFAAN